MNTNLAILACPQERDKEFEVRMVTEIVGKMRKRTEEVGKSHSQV